MVAAIDRCVQEGEEGDWTLQGLDVVLVVNSESIKYDKTTTHILLTSLQDG